LSRFSRNGSIIVEFEVGIPNTPAAKVSLIQQLENVSGGRQTLTYAGQTVTAQAVTLAGGTGA